MTAATITNYLETHLPDEENVVLTASDTDTFTSKKFSSIQAVQITPNEAIGVTPLQCSISGAVVTIVATGVSSKKMAVQIKGTK